MLFSLVRKSFFIQNLYINLSTLIHPSFTHSAGIIEVMKKAFWHVAMENISGGYFEFGVFQGTGMYAAAKIQRSIKANAGDFLSSSSAGIRKAYGFDSFDDGFKYGSSEEAHPVFREGEYTSSYLRCKKRLSRFPEVQLVNGYFENTIRGKDAKAMFPGEQCAIAFIDCDLKIPAAIALDFLRPVLQPGCIIILDDSFAYKGDPSKGVYGAWEDFLAANPTIKARRFFDYGCMGRSCLIYAV